MKKDKIKEKYSMYLQLRKVPLEKEVPVQAITKEKQKNGKSKV